MRLESASLDRAALDAWPTASTRAWRRSRPRSRASARASSTRSTPTRGAPCPSRPCCADGRRGELGGGAQRRPRRRDPARRARAPRLRGILGRGPSRRPRGGARRRTAAAAGGPGAPARRGRSHHRRGRSRRAGARGPAGPRRHRQGNGRRPRRRRAATGVRYAISVLGDVAVGGGEPWDVAVRSARSDAEVHRLRVRAPAAWRPRASPRASGGAPDGSYAHHVLDPATGRPAWTGPRRRHRRRGQRVRGRGAGEGRAAVRAARRAAAAAPPRRRAPARRRARGGRPRARRRPAPAARGRVQPGGSVVVAAAACSPPPPERSTSVATQRPLERRTVASMRFWPLRRPEKPSMRSNRVERVTLMRIVPRSESWRRKVRASRLTDTTAPSYSRVAAEATPLESARAEMSTTRNVSVVFMAAMLPTTPPTPPARAKPRQSLNPRPRTAAASPRRRMRTRCASRPRDPSGTRPPAPPRRAPDA